MRRAHLLGVSSTRDVCVFCAARRHGTNGANIALPTSSSVLPQRRHIYSSKKAPQYAEAQVYRDERRDTRPQHDRSSHMGRPRPNGPAQYFNRQPQGSFPPQRNPMSRGMGKDLFGLDQNVTGSSPRRGWPQRTETPNTNRYRTDMESRPPPMETPHFSSMGSLRARNDRQISRNPSTASFQQHQHAQPTQRRPVQRFEQAELDLLLGRNSNTRSRATSTPYARLSRGTGAAVKCMHCGQTDHRSLECPSKPVYRPQPAAVNRPSESLRDAAQNWMQTKGSRVEAQMGQAQYEQDRRRQKEDAGRRRSRVLMDAEPSPTTDRNRYEEPAVRRRGVNERRGRNRVTRAGEDGEEDEDYVSKAERKRQRKEAKKKAQLQKAEPTPVYLPEFISVANLASMLKLRVEDFVKKLEELGFEDVQNDHILNAEHAGLIAQEYNFEPIVETEGDDGDLYAAPAIPPEEYSNLPSRPPVVTIMGHVDHGKTTILDYIRSSSVVATEFGGITQHIGAFSVSMPSGKKITFLDTPGHAAFETMRARGANVTDIVILVVAADDSVMPQTVEAIKHAQAAGVAMIVAINKIDKQQADPHRVKQDLSRNGVTVEDFGGDIQVVEVSGKTGQGISDLEEAIMLQSEVLDHRADPKANIEGWVLEGTTKKSGKVATILVRSGTLRSGSILVAGTTWARVRTLRNEAGAVVEEAGPGIPVEVDGWREQPIAGDEVLQAEDEQRAAEVSELRVEKVERQRMAKDMEAINAFRKQEAERREAEETAAKASQKGTTVIEDTAKAASGPEIITFIVKADVSGSAEAVVDSVTSIGNNEVGTRILRSGVGSPSEFDVQHAADAGGHILNFNTPIPSNIAAMAEANGVKILDSNIIYRVVEDVKALLSEKLAPKITQRVTGEAEIAAVFEIGLGGKKKLRVAGSKVRNGLVNLGTKCRVTRKDAVIFDGTISSLKNQKKDVDQMRKDTECGIAFEGWEDFQIGDKIQCYEEKSEKRTL